MEQAASNDSSGKETDEADILNDKAGESSNDQTESKDEYKSKFYYLAAELENLKKRHQKEIESTLKFGSEKILRSLLEVVDNFERTISAMGPVEKIEDEKMKGLLQGIEMIRKQFLDVLAQNGLVPVESLGKDFDPNVHEALSQMVAAGKREGEIITEYQKGYLLNGRLLRPAKVVVAKAKTEEN